MSEPIPAGVIHNAGNDLKRLANFARGIIALDESVASFGGLTAAIEEAQARLDKLAEQEREMQAHISDAHRYERDVRARADQAADVAGKQAAYNAQLIVGNAQAAADQIVAEAKATANARRAEQTRQERELIDAIAAQAKVFEAGKADIATCNAALSELHEKLAAGKEKLDGIKAEIAALTAWIVGR